MTTRRAPGLLALIIGVCLVMGGVGVAVVQPRTTEIALETGPAPTSGPVSTAAPAAPPATTTVPTAVAPPLSTAVPPAPATRVARRTSAPTRAAAPGVTFTAPVQSASPSTPASSPVPAAAAGDSISTTPVSSGATTSTTSVGGHYAFLDQTPSGKPARWNPCAPIHYIVNPSAGPAGSLALVQQAVARTATATGMTFTFDGTTSEVPTSGWGFGPSASYPHGWQPLLIGFAHQGQSDLLEGTNAGTGFPVTLQFAATGELVDVSGAVAIDADQAAGLPMGFGGASVGSVLLHEVGHAVGMAHVQDPSEVMNPVVGPWTPAAWGVGDREGLRQLGAASGCTTTAPPAPWG